MRRLGDVINWPPLPEPVAESEVRGAPWWLALGSVCLAAIGLYFESQPAWWVMALIAVPALLWVTVLLMVLWCLGLACAVSRRTWRRPAWLLAPLIGIVSAVLFGLWVPFLIRFDVSRDALVQVAGTLRNTNTYLAPGRVGAFDLEGTWADGSAVYFTLGVSIDGYGIVFDPEGTSSEASSGEAPFAPGWYQWQD